MCSLDHSILVTAETLRIIAIFTNTEFLTVVLEKGGEDQLDRCVKNEVLHRVREERNIYIYTIKRMLTGLVTCCLGMAYQDKLLKETQKDISSG